MSKLREYRDTEQALKKSLERLELLKQNEELSKELAFEKKLITLLNRYSKKMEDLMAFIQPPASRARLTVQERRPAYGDSARKRPKKVNSPHDDSLKA